MPRDPDARSGESVDAWRGAALAHLTYLYGDRLATETLGRLEAVISHYRGKLRARRLAALSERDVVLISYADQVGDPGLEPLVALGDFCREHAAGLVSILHLLPFYPSSSDDGFAVMDYLAVDPSLGDWDDVARLGRDFRLMFDAVINHASVKGEWFQGFLRGVPEFSGHFIRVDGRPDLSAVVRPRTTPLLTSFDTPAGPAQLWTTFSDDQADLNYANPDVLLEVIDILLGYVERGAEFLRLDAVGYLWKEIGTACIHLPQTHRLIQLFRTVLDASAPHVLLVTEANVPHAENVSYFGDGSNEAQLVYNFALPPLVLHAFIRESASALSRWARRLETRGPGTAFLNFLASHDGIGLSPARGLLPKEELEYLRRQVEARGGLVSFKSGPDGKAIAYELNINYLDALSKADDAPEETAAIDRFVAAHAILFALQGLPALYFHSLFGSRGWAEGVAASGRNRTINRQKLLRRDLEKELGDPTSRRARVFRRLKGLLQARAASAAFAPSAGQTILDCGEAVFGVARNSADTSDRAVCLHNLSAREQRVDLSPALGKTSLSGMWTDLLRGEDADLHARPQVSLKPHEVRWFATRDPAGSGRFPRPMVPEAGK